MNESGLIKENTGKLKNLSPYFLFVIMAAVFFASGIFLKINNAYSFGAVFLLFLSLVPRLKFISFFSLVFFSYAIWEVKVLSLANIFLFSLGFVSSYIYGLQLSVSRGKEANPVLSYGAGLLLAAPYALFSVLSYKAFSSSLVVSPLGIMLVIFIIIFFRLQYYVWKGK